MLRLQRESRLTLRVALTRDVAWSLRWLRPVFDWLALGQGMAQDAQLVPLASSGWGW